LTVAVVETPRERVREISDRISKMLLKTR